MKTKLNWFDLERLKDELVYEYGSTLGSAVDKLHLHLERKRHLDFTEEEEKVVKRVLQLE